VWILRHLVSIALLSFTVAVLIPVWLARRNGTSFAWGSSAGEVALQLAGLALLCIGLLLFFSSLRRFAVEGEGTLAPWDLPRRLVLRGPYRYVRNPMISGVVLGLLGEALVLLSRPHLRWAVVFLAINAVYVPLFEEPMLAERFGESYRTYCRHVPRLLPRWKPWQANSGS
jgi:protein-S-isoprenylcysteine O-methyltransferase Ste14